MKISSRLRKTFRSAISGTGSREVVDSYRGAWRSIYFHHIGKTAGTSYSQWFEGMFNPSQICSHPGMSQRLLREDLSAYRFFRGHFPICFYQMLPPVCAMVSVIRDPKSVVLSGYNHLVRLGGNHITLYHRKNRQLESFEDFLNDDILRNRSTNFQTFSLGWDMKLPCMLSIASEIPDVNWNGGEDPNVFGRQCMLVYGPNDLDRTDVNLLRRAKRMLFEEAAAFGIVENESQSLKSITSVLGVPDYVNHLPKLNRVIDDENHRRLGIDDLSDAQLHDLKKMTALDQELYDSAVALLKQRSQPM